MATISSCRRSERRRGKPSVPGRTGKGRGRKKLQGDGTGSAAVATQGHGVACIAVTEGSMPIQKTGWELLITRLREDSRNGKRRTVGRYQVYHEGTPVDGLSGMCAETRGRGDNSKSGNNRRIEAGGYPLRTQDGAKYVTIGYKESTSATVTPRPGLDVGNTDHRIGILIHPGRGFLSSVGCINPAKSLEGPKADIDFVDSRKRMIALINDMKLFLGDAFPKSNGRPIPRASLVIDGEP